MLAHTDRPHAGTAATVGNAEGLVQVHVGHVGAYVGRPRQTDLGVEVGAVHVDLAAVAMDDLADLADALLVDAMGRGVGDHQAGQLAVGLRGLAFQVLQVDVALLVAVHYHHAHAGHLRRGRVGTVGRGRDEADVAVPFAAALVVAADGE
ncbi:hypothetical protein D3C84_458310 [compost metagenome]